jgi:hypothetical protein
MSKNGYRKEPQAKAQAQAKAQVDVPPAIPPSDFAKSVAEMLLGQGGQTAQTTQALGSTRDYPLPSYAVALWLSGGDLLVAMSPEPGESSGHTVRLPLSKLTVVPNAAGFAGWAVLLDLLKARERSGRSVTARKIGNPASPTGHEIEQRLVKRYDKSGQVEVTFDSLFGED